MKKEDFKLKAKVVNDVMDNVVSDTLDFATSFVDNFGMSMDQFERLDYDEQEKLIEKVTKLNKKKKHLLNLKKYYPIFEKTKEKRKIKSIFKRR